MQRESGDESLPDRRQHRGPHPQDQELFAIECEAALRAATHDLSWLLTRLYTSNSALKLVGDRYALNARQRLAVGRSACSDLAVKRRKQHEVQSDVLAGRELWIDGFNVLTSVEAALAGGVILQARDDCYRDMASMHGSYHKVEETTAAIHILGELMARWEVATARWLLDQPVSNSGRLKTILRSVAEQHGWNWEIELVRDPDPVLIGTTQIVASADSEILDQAESWFNLARITIDSLIQDAWILVLGK